MTLKEIESKTRGLLAIKKIRKGLSADEELFFSCLENKYRNKNGHLRKGSYYVNSDGQWALV